MELPRVIAKGPDGQIQHTLDLDLPHAVLLGRAPDPGTAPGAAEADGRTMRIATVVAPSVSANHALVWSDENAVCVRDLGSRNGTWLLLPRGETVRVTSADVVLHLAQSASEKTGFDEPPPPSWSSRRDFAPALAACLDQWLRDNGIAAHVAVVSDPTEGAEPPMRVPLANGEALDVVPIATADASWSRLLERLWRWAVRQNSIYEAEEETRREGMILSSRALRSAHQEVVDAARSGARTLLLTGSSGVGKEMLAEVFHRHSGRSGAFVPVNCSMFSKELLRSELFGAEVGAFTGATRRIVGAVERAQGGTLFLDEVGDMPPEVQPMLLRFLDRREFEHVGHYGRVQRADVVVVAATNRDLREMARTGGFRDDLWFRLSVHVVDVPSLRGRWEDVVAYLESLPMADGRHSMRDAFAPAALALLRGHAWEGNFRELMNFIQRLPRDADVGAIDVATCGRELERGALRRSTAPPSMGAVGPGRADWSDLTARAVQAFIEDHGHEPASWDEQKEWNEKYLKPLLFFHLSGAAAHPPPADDNGLTSLASQIAGRVKADRGTAAKQLARYFERFRR
ncbi:MAG TPA: sigma 54-interacting transcriptional regulator [Polyangiaceae bacterium]